MVAERKDYLGTVALVAVLLLGELETEGQWDWSNPAWLGTVSTLCAQLSWYFLLSCIIGCLVSLYGSVTFGVRLEVHSPSILLIIGIVLYSIEVCIDYYVEAFEKMVARPTDDEAKRNYFLMYSIPLWVWMVATPIYVVLLLSRERESPHEQHYPLVQKGLRPGESHEWPQMGRAPPMMRSH